MSNLNISILIMEYLQRIAVRQVRVLLLSLETVKAWLIVSVSRFPSLIVSICVFSVVLQVNGFINKSYHPQLNNSVIENQKEKIAETLFSAISIGNNRKDKYDDIIIEAARKYELDPFLVKAVIEVESQFNHRAVSNKGAKGLMQIMPANASLLGVNDMFDAQANIYGGAMHIRGLINRYKTLEKALGFYYAGNAYRRKPEIGYAYIKKVMNKYNQFKQINTYICKTNKKENSI